MDSGDTDVTYVPEVMIGSRSAGPVNLSNLEVPLGTYVTTRRISRLSEPGDLFYIIQNLCRPIFVCTV